MKSFSERMIALFIFAFCLFLYNATLTPGLSYASPDGNELTTVAATLGLAHPTGYPLYTWLGFLFAHLLPFSEVAHRTNLMSAILGAGGVAILYLILRRVELARPIAIFAALLFGVSTTFWSQAVITEVYAPNVFMLALTVLLLLKWADASTLKDETSPPSDFWFVLFALALGLGAGTHLSNLGFAPTYTIFILLTDWRILKRPLTILVAFIVFVLGLAQFLWIPFRAALINDPLIMRFPPNSLVGLYVYTLGAFSNLRFAFPITAMPERVVIYLQYLVQNFTVIGVALGGLGMWTLLFKHPKRFWLFGLMYFTNVFFFTQYKVFDLDVFFISSHFIFAIFIGCGAQQLINWLRQRFSTPRAQTIATTTAIIVFLFAPLTIIGLVSARDNNRTTDTAIGDFYKNVYAMLPRDSVLVSRRGVFGYDMYYWQQVYNIRPDVLTPSFDSRRKPAANAPVFSTVNVIDGKPQGGLWAPPREVLPVDAWYVPVLIGNQRDLTLYRASQTPPSLIVSEAQSQNRIDHSFDGLTLIGYDLTNAPDAPSPRAHLKIYWRVTQPRAYLVSTQIDNVTLETHDLGFGNLPRYVRENRLPREPIIVEEFDLVIPSYLKKGEHIFKIGLAEFSASGIDMNWIEVGKWQVK